MNQHTPSAYRLARAIVGEVVAADVVQEAFVAAWRELPGLRDPDRFVPWLHRIVVNRSRSVLRARSRIREIPMHSSDADRAAVSDDFRPSAEDRGDLAGEVARLSVDHRTVIGLHYGAGLPIQAVAETLGIPTGTAKSRLNAALGALRLALSETDDA